MVKFKNFSRPLSVFKANLIFKDFSRQSCIFKYFSSLCKPCPRLPSKSFKAAVPLNFSPSSIRVDSWQPGLCNDNPKAPTSAVLMRHILKLMYCSSGKYFSISCIPSALLSPNKIFLILLALFSSES